MCVSPGRAGIQEEGLARASPTEVVSALMANGLSENLVPQEMEDEQLRVPDDPARFSDPLETEDWHSGAHGSALSTDDQQAPSQTAALPPVSLCIQPGPGQAQESGNARQEEGKCSEHGWPGPGSPGRAARPTHEDAAAGSQSLAKRSADVFS